MEEPGVVLGVGVFEDFTEPQVDVRTVRQALEPAIRFDAPIFADAEEDDPVNDALNAEIEFSLGQARIAQGEVLGQLAPPTLDGPEKIVIDLGCAALGLVLFRVFVEGSLEDRVFGKDGGDPVPLFGVILEPAQENPGGRRGSVFVRFDRGSHRRRIPRNRSGC